MNDGSSFWTTFTPQGQSYLWRPDILWLNVISDTFITLAYFSIPLGLYFVLRQKPETPYRPLVIMFSLFIVACGITHLVGIWTVWHGDYGIHGISKGITAVISMATAVMLIPMLPKITLVHTPEELQILNLELEDEIESQRESTYQLRLTEQRFRSYLQHAPDGILIAHPGGAIVYSNETVSLMFGYLENELNGKWVTDLIPERARDLISPVHNHLFDDKKARSQSTGAEFTGMCKDGSEFPAEIRLSSVISEEQDMIVVTIRDMSVQKAREEDARKEFMELTHVSRLSTVGQMAAGLAHELNQPLTAISNNLHTAMSILRSKAEPDPLLTEILEENYASAQRAGQIIKSLRQLVRKDDGSKKETALNDLVHTTVKLITPEARAASVKIELDLDRNVPVTLLDSIQIQQVMVNLGRNAIEALSTTQRSLPMITFTTELQVKNKMIVIGVCDNGPGLSEEIKASLFKPYITSKESGMGLGLSICRSIVESQDGQLWYEDAEQGGALFYFTVPIIEEKR